MSTDFRMGYSYEISWEYKTYLKLGYDGISRAHLFKLFLLSPYYLSYTSSNLLHTLKRHYFTSYRSESLMSESLLDHKYDRESHFLCSLELHVHPFALCLWLDIGDHEVRSAHRFETVGIVVIDGHMLLLKVGDEPERAKYAVSEWLECIGDGAQGDGEWGDIFASVAMREEYLHKYREKREEMWVLGCIIIFFWKMRNKIYFIPQKMSVIWAINFILPLLCVWRRTFDGFVGGLNASNYMKIANTTISTTTRDLAHLVELGVLKRTGERKATRYWLVG